MVDLKKVTKGRVDRAPRVLIFGSSAIGKTTFASGAPSPFVIDADRGSHKLDVERVIPSSWTEVKEWVTAVEKGEVKCDTLVLDSITEMEALSHAELFGGEGIDKWGGGYGRGQTHALMEWRAFLSQIERVWSVGRKAIVFVAHAQIRKFEDPTGPTYDRFEVAAQPKLAGLLQQFVDYSIFAKEEIVTTGKDRSTKAITTGVRWGYTKRCPAFDAKARGTTNFPDRVPLSWADFAQAIKNDALRVEDVMTELTAMLTEIADEKYSSAVMGYLKEYPAGLVEARNRVVAKLDEVVREKGKEK